MTIARSVALIGAFACAGCVSLPGYGSPPFQGEVLDSATKAPIQNAQVSVTPFSDLAQRLSATTDTAGRFAIAGTPWRMSIVPNELIQPWTDARISVFAEGYEAQALAELDLTKGELPDITVYLKHR